MIHLLFCFIFRLNRSHHPPLRAFSSATAFKNRHNFCNKGKRIFHCAGAIMRFAENSMHHLPVEPKPTSPPYNNLCFIFVRLLSKRNIIVLVLLPYLAEQGKQSTCFAIG